MSKKLQSGVHGVLIFSVFAPHGIAKFTAAIEDERRREKNENS
jgi:hypothetical protein